MKTPQKKVLSFFRSKIQFSRANFIILALIIISGFLFGISQITPSKQNEKTLNDRIEKLTKENAGLKNVAWMESLHQPKLSLQEIQYLKNKGLKNPVKDIIADLTKHSELIPYRGTLGGKMGFHSEKDIFVLSTKLVRAYFDDGHAGGWVLLEYQTTNGNEISWKVLESYLE